MNALLDPFRQLVARRLWPVAVLLLAAAVAMPVLLADSEEPPAAVAAAGGPGAADDTPFAGDSIVAKGSVDGHERRRVLGARKDPFKPSGVQPRPARASRVATGSPAAGTAPASASPSVSSLVANAAKATTGGSSSGGAQFGGGGAQGGSAAPAPVSTGPLGGTSPLAAHGTPKPARPTYALYSLAVAFDDQKRTLKRLDALPDADEPLAIYLGLLKDAKTAVFLLDESVEAQGDGSCHPSPSDCQRLYLRKGDTEFLDVAGDGAGAGAEHQLDLLGIHAKRTASSAKAATVRATASSAGRRALRARMSRVGRLRYDARTGLLRRLR